MKFRIFLFTLWLPFLHSDAQTNFSQENATEHLQQLSVHIGPRPMGSPAEQRALRFAAEKFQQYGCDTAYVMPFVYTDRVNTQSGIAVGIKHGATKHIIVIGGHIDSAGPEIPGANDDGSGSVVVMEAARVLGRRDLQSTLVFCCFGGEEQGLEGSSYFVDNFPDIDSVVLMLQVDMANGLGVLNIDPDMHWSSAPRWLVRASIEEFSNLGYQNLVYPTHFFSLNYAFGGASGSDHESYLQKGIPAIDFTTDVDYPIHTPRDNFENFDRAGLKRSGDLVIKLVERFDSGIPSRELERYWLYIIGTTPLFVPIWGLWLFALFAVGVAVTAFIAVRKRREDPASPDRIRWSGVKMFLFAVIMVSFGWFSSDAIGLLKGLRHPWYSAIDSYILLAAIAMVIGGWIALRLANRLRLSRCPYVHFKRGAIILLILIVVFGFVNIKLTVEPAVALFLVSCAILIRQPLLKVVLVMLSPWWMWRLVFSEWSSLFFRASAHDGATSVAQSTMLNAVMILGFAIYFVPFLFSLAAVVRDSPPLNSRVPRVRSVWMFASLMIVFVGFGSYLLSTPAYNNYWYRDVHIDQRYDMDSKQKTITIKSSEYLSGLTVIHNGQDTTFTTHTTHAHFLPSVLFDTTWLHVVRRDETTRAGDTSSHDILLRLAMVRRPFTVSIKYSSARGNMQSFETPWKFRTAKSTKRIDWYSFPDSVLEVPVRFQTVGSDSVRETIEVVFDSLADPMSCSGELMYYIPRTTYTSTHVYR